MITTEITVRRGVRSVTDDGEITWSAETKQATRILTSSKVGIHTNKLCEYELQKALERIRIDVESDPHAEGYIGEGFSQYIEGK